MYIKFVKFRVHFIYTPTTDIDLVHNLNRI